MKRVIGVDPGLDGAITLYDGVGVRVWDMPTLNAGSGGKRVVDRATLFDLMSKLADAGPELCAVEQISGVRNQSAHASCEFGKSAGYAEMAVVGNRIPILMVPPALWKAHFRITGGADTKARKDVARRKAIDLLPMARELFARVKDDGRAESALLALYAFQQCRN
jgi:crossover junction endodeoxyribonuclease RuvC